MNALVINLTRFGDLLQGQPTLAGLAAEGYANTLLCLDNFSSAAGLLQHLDGLQALPGGRMLANLDRRWTRALSDFWRLAQAVRRELRPRLVVNLTASLPARLLTRALADAQVRGFGLDAHGFGYNGGAWATFLEAASLNRGASPFNVVDVFRRVAGLPPAAGAFRLREVDAPRRSAARERLISALGPAAGSVRGFVGLQLGASEDRRRWPVEHFSRLGAELWRRWGLAPVLLGSAAERPLAERFTAMAGHPAADMVGRTELPELAATLACLELLVTNDTGTMHLAAGLGVPVVALFVATAQPWDTGPYLPGAVSIEPDMDCHPCGFGQECPRDNVCRRAIDPGHVLGLAGACLGRSPWPAPAELAGARVWISRVDAHGYLDLASRSGMEDRDLTRWRRLQRHAYRRFLDAADHGSIAGPAAVTDWPAAPGGGMLAALAPALAEADGLLTMLAGQAEALALVPRPALKVKFLAGWQRLLAVLEANPALRVLGRMLACESQAGGEGLAAIRGCLGRYHGLVRHLHQSLTAGTIVD